MDRIETEVLDLDRGRRAHRHRSADDAPIIPACGDVGGLDLDLLGGPRLVLRAGPVLEREPPAMQRESVNGDVQRTARRSGAFDEIGEVEAIPEPDDAHDGVSKHAVADPDVAAQQRGQVQTEVQRIQVGKRRAITELGDVKPLDHHMARQEVKAEAIDANGPVGEGVEALDRDMAHQRRQRHHRHGDHGKQAATEQAKPAACPHC